jgi:hypothetical protein
MIASANADPGLIEYLGQVVGVDVLLPRGSVDEGIARDHCNGRRPLRRKSAAGPMTASADSRAATALLEPRTLGSG